MTTTAQNGAALELGERARLARRLPSPALRRAIRLEAGLSTVQLGRAMGVTRQAVSQWETGTRTPRGDHLIAYVAVLDELRRVVA
ncbi:helix-turn-helix domain-containing protein [Knoellia sp. CPCC 206453]|uniref:helix-turn-helix domain-containing protein n=1 Tax=Knoellia pratensis TaxID=3404796 RepID=UPI00361ECFED